MSSTSGCILTEDLPGTNTFFAKTETTRNISHQNVLLLGHKSKLSTSNTLLICNKILKPICTYRIQLWGTASNSNTEILERFQSKALCMIMDTPWYVPNTVILRELQIPTVKKPQHTPKWSNSERLGAIRQQTIAKTPAKWSAYQFIA
jgi:hypothetical protein